jgi:hypothetical protein
MENQLYLYVASISGKKNKKYESKALQKHNFVSSASKATSDLLVHKNKCTK